MRSLYAVLTLCVTSMFLGLPEERAAMAPHEQAEQSMILEVEGNPVEHANYLKTYHPFIEVVMVYDDLFNGIAIKGTIEKLARMASLDFIKTIHPVKTYAHPEVISSSHQNKALYDHQRMPLNLKPPEHQKFKSTEAQISPQVIPNALNPTPYKGSGVKVGVIDTGIDFNHPDLASNYKGGYDLVDLDDEPMETTVSEGAPTIHGTHVAGIIAANGQLQGVAPEAELYAYRALGPGGQGTSIQVIAALEQAVKDEVDIINLSLGNAVNGPDYPTSQAVNKAAEKGIVIVIASGNDGPGDWTVGSPATAVEALSVGATTPPTKHPYLYAPSIDKRMDIAPMIGSASWALKTDYPIQAMANTKTDLTGMIALVKRGDTPFYELAQDAEARGAVAVLIMNKEAGLFQGSVIGETPLSIPVAGLSQKDGQRLINRLNKTPHLYVETMFENRDTGIASFSSRGPVTVTWDIKPQLVAPGANILSTVPKGYQQLQGTSMAAPHVAGAVAVIKQAHPDWTQAQIKAALTTTAQPLLDEDDNLLPPTSQGAGQIMLKEAIQTETIVHNAFLTFGKVTAYKQTDTKEVVVENLSEQPQTYTFNIPVKQSGLTWSLPQAFTIKAGEKKSVSIELSVTPMLLKEGIHEGWLELQNGGDLYRLPYLFINETADYPKAMGLGIAPKPLTPSTYEYSFYVPNDVAKVKIDLYNPYTLIHDRTLLELSDVSSGLNEGELTQNEVGTPGEYRGLITMEMADRSIETMNVDIFIPPIQ
ncbi:S8 family serine peptidase [Lentibacillus saliphilus]|uniref:S8 family serine peptidase n=1 Tax=Lentibacillus saliphilus TaxID=2737028 RepID=UPI001C2FF8FA|nr:S8 family serine peptidase [Lentibacillus saliphilus]